jgi:hypothetical protein
VSVNPCGNELHVLDVKPLEDPDEAGVDHEDAERGPAEVQRVSRNVERKAWNAAQLEGTALEELPRVELLPRLILGSAKMPPGL